MIGVLAAAFACLIVAGGLTGTSGAGAPVDTDSDGIYDYQDNCDTVANAGASNCDTNSDGYGNICDTDFDDNGATGASDLGTFKNGFGKSLGQPGYDPDLDLDCNNAVGASDLGTFKNRFGTPPGTSGLSCAGTITCP
jgi:hypothetical protein